MTGGLVLGIFISEGIAEGNTGLLGIGLILALPFVIGWRLLRSRPRIGAAVTGLFAAAWLIFAVTGPEGAAAAVTNFFLFISLLSGLAAVVLSVLVIRSP